METSQKQNLAIIGAGPSGILSARYAIQNGFDVTLFEKKPELGGIWSQNGYAWPYMTTNLSKYVMGWLDFQWRDYDELFPKKNAVQQFLTEYCKTFNILQNIKYNSQIKIVKLIEESNKRKFSITYEDLISNNLIIEKFDKIIIATGSFSKPDYVGMEKYLNDPKVTLKITHISQHQYPENYKNKRVLVYGHGHSACQISKNISFSASSLINLFRTTHWIIPITLYNKEYDKILPNTSILWSTMEKRIESAKLSTKTRLKLTNQCFAEVTAQNSLGMKEFYKDPNSEENVKLAACDDYFKTIKRGLFRTIKSEIESIDGNNVILKNGEKHEIDEIILGTGYFVDISFLDSEILKKLNYDPQKKQFPMNLEGNNVFNRDIPDVAFVGFAPTESFFATLEFQSILAVNFLKYSFFEEYMKKHKIYKKEEYEDYVDPLGYQSKIAEEAGYLIDLNLIEKEDKELYEMVLRGPTLINSYHLTKENWGTDVWKKNAEIIKRYNRQLKKGFLI